MKNKIEYDIDSMQYRKSSHLASVDVEMIIAEKGECVLTIENCRYERGVMVNGTETDAYYIKFVEPVKELLAISTNRKTIGDNFRAVKKCTSVESRRIKDWAGFKISLIVDENVKMRGKIVSGIRIKKDYQQPKPKTLDQAKAAFTKVTDRTSFVQAMTTYKEFMGNVEIQTKCTELSKLYPNPVKN